MATSLAKNVRQRVHPPPPYGAFWDTFLVEHLVIRRDGIILALHSCLHVRWCVRKATLLPRFGKMVLPLH